MKTAGKGTFLKPSRKGPHPFPQGEGLHWLTLGALLIGKSGHSLLGLPGGPVAAGLEAKGGKWLCGARMFWGTLVRCTLLNCSK